MTGVATQLGLERFEVPSVTISSWRSWSVKDDRLAGLDDPHHLRRWLQQGSFAEVNAALAALGALAHVEGGDDLNAAVTLAWAVLPGMTRLANQLRQVSADIDHAVAAQVWLAVRTVPATRHSVAARLAYRVRGGVLRDELHDPRMVPVGDRLPVSAARRGGPAGLGCTGAVGAARLGMRHLRDRPAPIVSSCSDWCTRPPTTSGCGAIPAAG